MRVKHEFRKLLWKIGYDICKFDPTSYPLARKQELFESYEINVVLDVGANIGQFAEHIRNDIGYSGKIVSFEPLRSVFEVLRKKVSGNPQWKALNFALGDAEISSEINIAKNSVSSSLLNMLPSHLKAAPESEYIGKEKIEVKTLDSVYNNICSMEDNVYLKIDTQGFESKVIKGAKKSLACIDTIELEMSLVPLYQGELLFNEMFALLSKKKYSLVFIEPVYFDKDLKQILQINGIFHRF